MISSKSNHPTMKRSTDALYFRQINIKLKAIRRKGLKVIDQPIKLDPETT